MQTKGDAMVKYVKDYREYITLPSMEASIKELKNGVGNMKGVYSIEAINQEELNLSNLIQRFYSLGGKDAD